MRKINNRKHSTVSPQNDGFCAGKNNLKYSVSVGMWKENNLNKQEVSEDGQAVAGMAKQENILCHDYDNFNKIKSNSCT